MIRYLWLGLSESLSTPIREVDGRKVYDERFPVTRKLEAAYDEAVRGRNKKHAQWVSYVK